MRARSGVEVAHHAGHGGDAERQGVERVERALLVLLHVLRIGERQALHHDQQAGQRADDAAGLAAHEFGRVGIALLRHDRGAGREPVRQRARSRTAASPRARSPRRSATGARRRSRPPPAFRARSRGRTRCRANWRSAGRSRAPPPRRARSIGKEVPASAAAPSGHSFSARARVGEAAAVARRASRHRRAGGGRTSRAGRTADG